VATLLCYIFRDIVLLVEGANPHPDSDWSDFLDACDLAMSQNNGKIRVLVVTEGAGPNAKQRQLSLERGWRGNRSPVAVVTDSQLARGIITVFAWFNLNIRAFSTRNLSGGFEFLDCNATEIMELKNAIAQLRKGLGLPPAQGAEATSSP
jgi:stage II sporulation SpoAA-like protein